MKRKKIIIVHQYYCPEHFEALYENPDLDIEFRNIDPFFYFYKICFRRGGIKRDLKLLIKAVRNFVMMFFVHDEILLLGFTPFNPILFLCLPFIKNNKTVFFTSWPFWGEGKSYSGPVFISRKWENIVRDNCFAVACVNLKSHDHWKNYLPSFLVEHSIKVEKYAVKSDYSSSNRLLFIGRKVKYKNLDILLDIVHRCEGLELDVVGAGLKGVEDRGGRIKYLGRRDKSWVRENMCHYDALVMPSDWKEPFGIVLLEAMASALPIIVTPTAGTDTIFRGTDYRFMARSSSRGDIETAILEFVRSAPEERKESGDLLKERSYRYSVEGILDKWSKIIDTDTFAEKGEVKKI